MVSFATYDIAVEDEHNCWRVSFHHLPKNKIKLPVLRIETIITKEGKITEFETVPTISKRDAFQLSIDFLSLEKRAVTTSIKKSIVLVKHALNHYYLGDTEYELGLADYLILSEERFAKSRQYSNDAFTLKCVLNFIKRIPDIDKVAHLKRLQVVKECLLLIGKYPAGRYCGQELLNNLPQIDKSDYKILQKVAKTSYLDQSDLANIVNALCSVKKDTLLHKKLKQLKCVNYETLLYLPKVKQIRGLTLLKLPLDSMVELARTMSQPNYLEDITHMLNQIQKTPPNRLNQCKSAENIIQLHDWCVAELLQLQREKEQIESEEDKDITLPFPAPYIQGTKDFIPLMSYEELITEGQEMNHCIGSQYYAEKATKRSC